MTTKEILKEIHAAFEREPRMHAHRNHIQLDLKEGVLILEGEVDEIAAKKLAVEIAGAFAVNGLEDRLRLVAAEPVEDGAIRDSVLDLLMDEPTLKNCALRAWIKDKEEIIREAQPESGGAIHVFVEDGIVTLEGRVLSLSHQRLAGVLAWWVPGCRDVDNKLRVNPPEEDNDDEINDAVNLVLEKDRTLPAGQIRVTTRDRVVTLEGLVFRETEKKIAETDTWYVQRVRNVVNKIEVRQ